MRPYGLQYTRLPCSLHYLLELAQTHVHWVGDAIQASHLLTPFSCPQCFPAPASFPMSWLFASGSQMIGASASVLPVNIQDFSLGLTGLSGFSLGFSLISLQSKGLSRVFSGTTIWKHQFFSTQTSLQSRPHIYTWLLEKPGLWLYGPLLAKWCLCFLICCLCLS